MILGRSVDLSENRLHRILFVRQRRCGVVVLEVKRERVCADQVNLNGALKCAEVAKVRCCVDLHRLAAGGYRACLHVVLAPLMLFDTAARHGGVVGNNVATRVAGEVLR